MPRNTISSGIPRAAQPGGQARRQFCQKTGRQAELGQRDFRQRELQRAGPFDIRVWSCARAGQFTSRLRRSSAITCNMRMAWDSW